MWSRRKQPVGQVRQSIVMGHVIELCFGPPPLGDVAFQLLGRGVEVVLEAAILLGHVGIDAAGEVARNQFPQPFSDNLDHLRLLAGDPDTLGLDLPALILDFPLDAQFLSGIVAEEDKGLRHVADFVATVRTGDHELRIASGERLHSSGERRYAFRHVPSEGEKNQNTEQQSRNNRHQHGDLLARNDRQYLHGKPLLRLDRAGH